MMHFKINRTFLILTLGFYAINLNGQKSDPSFLKYLNHPWVDSVLSTLPTRDKVAQLIWVPAYTNRDLDYEVGLSNLIAKTGIGGVVFFQDKPVRETEMINYFNKLTKVPLLYAMDGEWGVGMRLEGVTKYPFQMTLGAITDDSLIYLMGKSVAGQFKRAGIQINLAPVADVNNNPANPVINYRSFGENPDNVSRKTLMYMKGMQDNGIMAVGKHFPGHGDTGTDSHLDLPVIRHTRERLDSVELKPFRSLINNGIEGIMPGHLNIPALDTAKNRGATISYSIITGLLKNDLGFKGLIFSDAMNMQGLTKYFATGEAEALALKAGQDVLEYVLDPEKAIDVIMQKIEKGEISKESIDEKCRKVLAAKCEAGLNKSYEIATANILNELTTGSSKALIRKLYANALTVLRNEENIIPVKYIGNPRIASVAINRSEPSVYQQRVSDYYKTDIFCIDTLNKKNIDALLTKLKSYEIVIAGIFNTDQRPNMNFGIQDGLNSLIEKLNTEYNCIFTYFGNPYALKRLGALEKSKGLILAYQLNDFTEDLSAQLIFGGIGAKGKLPVTISNSWPSGFGIETKGNLRLQYGFPESAGISTEKLTAKTDSIVNAGLSNKAFPGCEVMIARNGIVVLSKTYGYQTYEKIIPVSRDDLFDLASVTKISAALPGIMVLDTEGKFSPEATLGSYLHEFKGSNKSDLAMKDILTHQAGLTPFIPFWKETIDTDGRYKRNIYRTGNSAKYPYEVASGLYINRNYRKKMFREIKKSKLGERKYVYSDLAFIITPEIISRITGEKWNEFVKTNIYEKIGASDLVFNPYLKYPSERIIPTEYDSLFRKQQLRGTVHDEGAAMLGGISGHAGLFATSNDLMKLMELYRRKGEYGGEQIIGKDIVEKYTRVQFPENNNRRGLGFDKPLLNNSTLTEKEAYPAVSASPSSFGHSGYTGTFVWVDPDKGISYIFLCNRVYPTRYNNKVSDMNIRTGILQGIYDSIIK
jgi:beta-N-acetylhexosaminidase